MAKVKNHFGSQLFLFADKFNKNLEDVFSGSVIIEYDLISHTNIGLISFSKKEKELELFNTLVSHFDRQYKKARVIINHKNDALLMYQLGASNSHAYKLKTQNDYKALSSISKALEHYQNLLIFHPIFNHQKDSFQASIEPITSKEMTALKKINSKIDDDWNIYLDHMTRQLKDSFSRFQAVK
jgi:hypothetical protein